MEIGSSSRRVALITGASRGIGKAIALDLAKEHFSLGLVGRDKEALENVALECAQEGVQARCYLVDIEDLPALSDLAAQVAQDLGGITVLVNNAGISIEKNIRDATLDEWESTLNVNLRSVFALTKAALPYLEQSQGAAIINIASIASRQSYAGGSMYTASKHGELGFSNSLFHDVREQGIKVCSILPGYVNTAMHENDTHLDPALMIQPEDIARTVRFIVNFPENSCPTEITILPQRSPKRKQGVS